MGKLSLSLGGSPAKKTDRVASHLGKSPMKRDRGYETCPNNPTKKIRGTESPVR